VRLSTVTAVGVLLSGCATVGGSRYVAYGDDAVAGSSPEEWQPYPVEARPQVQAPSTLGEALARRAGELVGLTTLKGVSPALPDDCTGLARTVYESVGIDLMFDAQRVDSGVSAMYRLAYDAGALHRNTPLPGDLIFFIETYDRNRDGKRNDGLTHVAVVESVAPDGTVTFVHRAGSGVSRSHLNLLAPAQHQQGPEVLNDWLRPKSRITRAWLTGELFAGYASADLLGRAWSQWRQQRALPVSRR
jgi:hypothetical protein